jgi:hypothetical protein
VTGQWNFVPLPQPVPLSIATTYMLETGAVGGVPVTANLWGAGEPWANGVTSGPLFAPPAGPNSTDQGPAAAGSNPTKVVPVYSSAFPYWWLDAQISTEAPPGSSCRLWPGMPLVVAPPKTTGTQAADTNEQSAGTEFSLSVDCTLNKIWFWSPTPNPVAATPAAALLPGACAIFDIGTQQIIPGTLRGVAGKNPATMPDWRKPDGSVAKPGDGWVYCSYDSITLQAGKRYKTAVYCYGGGTVMSYNFYFFAEQRFYFGPVINDTTGAVIGPATAPNGITNGPLSSPNVASASLAESNGELPTVPPGTLVPGNSTYQNNNSSNTGNFLYPNTYDSSDDGETRWIDVEVTPLPKPSADRSGAMATFFV